MNRRDAAKKRFSGCSGPVCSSGSACATVSLSNSTHVRNSDADGGHDNDIEMARLENALLTPKSPQRGSVDTTS